MNDKTIYLDPNEVHTDDRLQVRSLNVLGLTDREAVEKRLQDLRKRLFKVIDSGEHVDPIELIEHDGKLWVFDGHNRLEVYKKVRQKRDIKIPALVLPYTYRQALAKGHTVNTRHGVGLTSGEASQAAFRSCVYSTEDVPTNELIQQGLGERLAQKIKQAARVLREEAAITEEDHVHEIDAKIARWCAQMAKQGYAPAGSKSIRTDDHGFPRYRFVLDRKPTKELNEGYLIERMAQDLEKLVEQDPEIFLRALKKVSHKSRMGLPVTVKTNPKRKTKQAEPEELDF